MSDLNLLQSQIESTVELYSKGEFEEALSSVQDLIASNPTEAILFNICGFCYKALNHIDLAEQNFNRAVSLKPDYFEANFNLGILFQDQGNLSLAINSYINALKYKPNYFEALNNMGVCQIDLGNINDAINSLEKAISFNPQYAEAYNNIGNALAKKGEIKSAIDNYKKTVLIDSSFFDAYFNLGNALRDTGQNDAAIECFEKALKIEPKFANAHNNIGITYLDLGKNSEAVKSFIRAIHVNPNYAEALNNLGIAYYRIGQCDDAIKFYDEAIKIYPDYADAFANMGLAYQDLKKFNDAVLSLEKAFDINPNLDFIQGNLLHSRMHLCIWDDFFEQIQSIKDQISNSHKAINPFPLSALIDDPGLQKKAAEIFSDQVYLSEKSIKKIEPYANHEKIRLGYFSADFRDHPVANLTAELYEIHNRNTFEIYAFSFGPNTNDEMNLRIKSSVDKFYDVSLMPLKDVVMLSRSLEIDIAIDLGGYTSNSRKEIFEMYLAPIQLGYIGFLGTMGSKCYDYLIADEITIPIENQKYFSEKIAYVPCYQMNDSKLKLPSKCLTREDLDLPKSSFIFCCFNNTFKITPSNFDSWAKILKNVDGSLMVIYAENPIARKNLSKEMKARGLDPNRLIFADHMSKLDYLARYRVFDLFLDTFPYNAGTTASDAIRMGLPIITRMGKSFASRLAASILNGVKLPELIALNQNEYESLAISLGNNPSKLKNIKEKLLNSMSSSPLYDSFNQVKSLEFIYSKMHNNLKERKEIDHINLKKN